METYQDPPLRTLEDYWAIMRRRRWFLILPLFLTWTMVLVGSRFIPPKYRSETVIIVEQQRGPEQYVLPNLVTDVQERLQSMTQQILSRTRLEGIIHQFGLYRQDRGPTNSEAAVERMRQDIKLDVIPSPGRPWELSAFKVAYSATNPELAQQVTNNLTSLFIAENLSSRQRSSENTTAFLESELQLARQNLDGQEQRLQAFKSRHLGELPEQLQNSVQTVSALQTRLQLAQEAVDESSWQESYLESVVAQSTGLESGGGPAVSLASVEGELTRLRAEYADLLSRYTVKHPDVLRVKEKILAAQKLEQRLSHEAESGTADVSRASAAGAGSLASSRTVPLALPTNGPMRANRLKIEHREQEVKRLERQIEDYQRRLNVMPLREQELAAVTRDHDQARANYESLLAKKNQSEMAADLEKNRQGDLFRIIDPPNLPQKPYWPDRFKFSLLGLALGTLLAAGVTALAEIVDARIDRGEDVRSLLKLPVLAGIPILQSVSELHKEHRHRRMEAIAASLLLTLISVMTFITFYRG
ncbi:MAG TPA: Wzz/FepE/Etk N-terminal domain-containing protein [Candidatus Saccharimonadales bacterium]|nr:Wzz/FepE/Etk N-terminal domain-containing protein [Candidatus Saccharimonadales bacterium]